MIILYQFLRGQRFSYRPQMWCPVTEHPDPDLIAFLRQECNASTADLDRYSVPTSTLLQQISPGLSTPPLPPANTTALVLYSSGVHSTLSFTPTFVNGVMLPEDEARANALTKKLVRAKKAQHRPKATTKQYGPAAREYTVSPFLLPHSCSPAHNVLTTFRCPHRNGPPDIMAMTS